MKNIKFIFLSLLFLSLTYSCEQKEKSTTPDIEGPQQSSPESSEVSKFMQFSNAKKIEEINNRIDPKKRVESLRWEKHTEHGSEFSTVTAYINEDGSPIKIIEHFIDGNFRPEGDREYYLENDNLICTQEFKDVWIDSSLTQYIETKTVYKNDRPAMTITRSAAYADIQDSTWNKIPTKEHVSMEKVNNILEGKGRFQTNFISVIKSSDLFILLGENKEQDKDRYTTALRVDKMTPFIEDLLNNLDKYKFRPLEIKFKIVGGNNQPEYRVLTDIHWKN